MARKIKATPQKKEMREEDVPETPLLDLFDAAVTAVIRSAKKRGYSPRPNQHVAIGRGQVRADRGHPDEVQRHGHQCGGDHGCRAWEEVATGEELEEEAEDENALVEVRNGLFRPKPRPRIHGGTDDPVRVYLRDMGSKDLLSREGEIAIAKRIEFGREAMIAGLCESPLTFQAVISGGTSSTRERCCFATSSTSTQPMLARRHGHLAPVMGPDGQLSPGIAISGQPERLSLTPGLRCVRYSVQAGHRRGNSGRRKYR